MKENFRQAKTHTQLIHTFEKPCLHPVSGRPFTPYPLFQWYLRSKEILINLSMKGSNSV